MDRNSTDNPELECEYNASPADSAWSSWDPMTELYHRKAFNSYDEVSYDTDYTTKLTPVEGCKISPSKGDSEVVKLYVANIPLNLTQEGLKKLFSRAGKVANVRICQSKNPSPGVTFGFISFYSVKSAAEAIRLFHDFEIGPTVKLYVKRAYTESEKIFHKARQQEEDPSYYNLYAGLESSSDKAQSKDKSASEMSLPSPGEELQEPPSPPANGDVCEEPQGEVQHGSPCATCAKSTLKRCRACKTFYCSKECQKKDWSRHKDVCSWRSSESNNDRKIDLSDDSRWTVSLSGFEDDVVEEPECDFALMNVDESSSDRDAISTTGIVTPAEGDAPFTDENAAPADDHPKIAAGTDAEEFQEQNLLHEVELRSSDLPFPPELPDDFIFLIGDLLFDGCIIGHPVTEQESSQLSKLTEDLAAFVNSFAVTHQLAYKHGRLVLAEYMDEWARAEMISYDETNQEVDVLFIDFGNRERYPLSHLRPLPQSGGTVPPMARTFKLSEVPPFSDIEVFEDIKLKTKERFASSLLEAHIIGKEQENCELLVEEQDSDQTVNDFILSMLRVQSSTNKDISKERKNISTEGSLIGSCDSERKAVMISDLPLQVIPDSECLSVTLTEVISPFCMYGWVLLNGTVEAMASLIDELNASHSPDDGVNFLPKVDEVCVAFFPEDGTWYRARVIMFNNDQTVRVSYLDFGNAADVDADMIRPIKESLLKLPRQAICFSLEQFEIPEDTLESATNLLKEVTFEKQCKVKILNKSDNVVVVDLFCPEDDKSVTDLLRTKYGRIYRDIRATDSDTYAEINKKGGTYDKETTEDVCASLPVRKDLPQAQTLPSQFDMILGDVIDERTVFAHPIRDEESLDLANLIRNLEDYYKRENERNHGISRFYKGGLVAVNFMGEWSRAELIGQDVEGDDVEVFYIDFGNKERRSWKDLNLLPAFALSLAPQAYELTLAKINRVDDPKGRTKAMSFLQEKLGGHKVVRASVCSSVDAEGTLVELEVEEDDKSVNDQLLRMLDETFPLDGAAKCEQSSEEKSERKRIMISDLPAPHIPSSKSCIVSVTEVVSSEYLYGWIIEDGTLERIAALIDRLNSCYVVEDGESYTPIVDEVVAAVFPEDGSWYRGVVIGENENGQWRIKYLDFGNECDVESSLIRCLTEDLKGLAPQATKLKLYGMSNAFNTSEVTAWIEHETEGKEYTATIINVTGSVLSVELYSKGEEDKGVSMNETLRNVFAHLNIEEKQKERVPSNIDDEKVVMKWKPALLPMVKNLRIIVHRVLSPGKFFGALKYSDFDEELEKLSKLIPEKCTEKPDDVSQLAKYSAICAKGTDGRWYRAMVSEVHKSDVMAVLVDFGKVENFSVQNIRMPSKEVLSFPKQSFAFSLHGVRPSGERWDETSCSRFRNLVIEKECVFTVESVSNLIVRGVLNLPNLKSSVNEILLSEKLAVSLTRHVSERSAFGDFHSSKQDSENERIPVRSDKRDEGPRHHLAVHDAGFRKDFRFTEDASSPRSKAMTNEMNYGRSVHHKEHSRVRHESNGQAREGHLPREQDPKRPLRSNGYDSPRTAVNAASGSSTSSSYPRDMNGGRDDWNHRRQKSSGFPYVGRFADAR